MSGRVLVADPWVELAVVEEALRPAGVEVEATDHLEGDDVAAVIVSINRAFGRAELDKLPALRAVATCSTGVTD
jgi:lactate dehydrogenase-like 2-hydroxyacid dehydrogenase